MTRSEVEAVTRPHKGEAALLCTAIGVLLDIREALDLIHYDLVDVETAIKQERESRDSAWTRAVPEPRMKGGRRA